MRKKLIIFLFLIIIIFSDLIIFKYCNMDINDFKVEYKISASQPDKFQIFYTKDGQWLGENGHDVEYPEANKEIEINVSLPIDIQAFRIDLGNKVGNSVTISDVTMKYAGKKYKVNLDELYDGRNQESFGEKFIINDDEYNFKISVDDPFMVYNISQNEIQQFTKDYNLRNSLLKLLVCFILDIIIIYIYKYRKAIIGLVKELKNNRKLITNLSLNDFKIKYAGSYLGMTWAFVQPIVTILVYWFVFQYGLRTGSPEEGVPFVLWFVTGLIAWFFFSDAINNATNSFTEYSYLVKKVKFKISILPIVKILSSFYVHIVFLIILTLLYIVAGNMPTIYFLQIIYYCFCLFCLVIAISYATSAIVVFFKDLSQIINIVLQVGMWMTPILWSYTILSEKLLFFMKLNPMFYIVEGYRDCFIGREWFYAKYFQTIYFWCFTMFLFLIGIYIFRRLKPHFSDVL